MSELICPECQYKNDPEATYCEECGVLLEKETDEAAGEGGRLVYKPGDVIQDRYEVLSVHHTNIFDSSYLSIDHAEGDKKVWIKQKQVDEESGAEYREQEKLYETLMKSPHRNLVQILNTFRSDSAFFTVYEYLDGQNLQIVMDHSGKSITQELVLELALQAGEGLRFLHSLGILHRDIQPSHLFLTKDGFVKIFGFSRVCSTTSCPADNAVTDGYSPPEAYGLMGGKIDERSDIFSLGVTIYSLLIGKTPKFSRESFFTFVFQTEATRKVEPALEFIVTKAVKKEPAERFASIDEMLDRLQKLKKKGLHGEREQRKDLVLEITSKSHVGKVRSINQDSCLVSELAATEKSKTRHYKLLVVADGMGGEAEGDKASSMAIRVIAQEVMRSYLPIAAGADTARLYNQDNIQERSADILRNALAKANRAVFEYSREDPARRGMGSTISSALIEQDNVCICHAGDTRVYVFNRKRGLIQITEDHSLVGRLVRMGQMTREEAQHSPQRSAVYRALGTTPELDVDVYQYTLHPGDYLLLCSDGVWEYYSDQELVSIILEEGKPEKIQDRLIQTCLDRGADDNATVIVVNAREREVVKGESKTMLLSQVDRIKRAAAESAAEAGEPEAEEPKPAERSVFPPRPISDKRMREEMEKQRLKEEMEKSRSAEEAKEPAAEETAAVTAAVIPAPAVITATLPVVELPPVEEEVSETPAAEVPQAEEAAPAAQPEAAPEAVPEPAVPEEETAENTAGTDDEVQASSDEIEGATEQVEEMEAEEESSGEEGLLDVASDEKLHLKMAKKKKKKAKKKR